MALRNRLARLTSAGPADTEPRAPFISFASPAPSAPARDASEASAEDASGTTGTTGEPAPSSGPGVLEDLRRRMDAILTRNQGKVHAPPQVDVPELPFCVERTELGPLHVRTLRLSGAHRVGRVPVTGARKASRELLALLALDPSLAACDPAGALYLDTETTGLGPGAGTVAFLIGLAWWDEGVGLVCEQLLVRQLGEEAPVLQRVAERIAQASMLVTFNGKSFDLPVLRTRFVMGRAPFPREPPHLDLVHVARRLHHGRGFGARLGAVEREVLGFVREDDVPSGEVCACYLHFLRTGDPRALLGVVEHNLWDVVSMAAIVALYGEPFEGSQLHADDLVGVARTLKRAGQKEHAEQVIEAALERGAGHAGLRVRADLSKARGDKARALADFETLAATVDDPSVRLELAKLYEHHAKDAARALAVVAVGTGETEERRGHRAARLAKKVATVARAAVTPRTPAAKRKRRTEHGPTGKLW
ncbi:MAG: hypothetical protein JWP97_853 [Labilithrix sp.]|nr:hypothetical protein [Labilithrix sp.]